MRRLWRRSSRRPRRVIQLIIDGMHPRVLRRELAAGRLPHFGLLADAGRTQWDAVSVFPTSTPTAVSSILTGVGPDRHHIPGMYWWDRRSAGPVYYGERIGIIRQHFDRFFENIVDGLNGRHLNTAVRTVFEHLHHHGLDSASINNLCFRGPHAAPTTLPYFLRAIPGVRFAVAQVHGPRHLRFGDFARSGSGGASIFGEEGPFRQFGISDSCTLAAFLDLAGRGELPPYLSLYFPDNDVWSHEHGPESTGVILRRLDGQLGCILDALGGRERALENNTFVVVADHAQMPVGTRESCAIDLDLLLHDLHRLPLGQPWRDEDAFICPNCRFAQIYLHPGRRRLRERVIDRLRADARIDHLLWREGAEFHVLRVAGQRRLRFRIGGPLRDRFGNAWSCAGDLSALELETDGAELTSYAYPDALLRIAEALQNPSAGDILLTATPEHEFAGNGEEIYLGGGSHGGLHREESLVPLLVAGASADRLLRTSRTVDVLDLTLSALNLKRTG